MTWKQWKRNEGNEGNATNFFFPGSKIPFPCHSCCDFFFFEILKKNSKPKFNFCKVEIDTRKPFSFFDLIVLETSKDLPF